MLAYAIQDVVMYIPQVYKTSQVHHRLMITSFMALVVTHKGLAACKGWPYR